MCLRNPYAAPVESGNYYEVLRRATSRRELRLLILKPDRTYRLHENEKMKIDHLP